MDLSRLREPFPESDIEWRLSQCGKTREGKIWAQCLAYIQARAIMDRLDEVVGPDSWMVRYNILQDKGVICTLAICCDKELQFWVEKQDGAQETDIEPFKGGISGALKRAGSVWGIGRYLYKLEATFATIVERGTEGAHYGRTKEKEIFYWVPPKLPAWALPKSYAKTTTITNNAQPAIISAEKPGEFKITFGKFKGLTLEQVGIKEMTNYVEYLKRSDKPSDQSTRLIERYNSWAGLRAENIVDEMPPRMGDEDVPF